MAADESPKLVSDAIAGLIARSQAGICVHAENGELCPNSVESGQPYCKTHRDGDLSSECWPGCCVWETRRYVDAFGTGEIEIITSCKICFAPYNEGT